MREPARHLRSQASSTAKNEGSTIGSRFILMIVTTLMGVGIGYALAISFHAPSETRDTPATLEMVERAEQDVAELEARDDEIARLRRELEVEQRERRSLEDELAALQDAATGESPPAEVEIGVPQPPEPPTPTHVRRADEPGPWFDRAALASAGLSSSEISEIEARFERFEMEKLELVDRARREGGFRSGPYNRAVQEMTLEFREDLGPSGYDAYLYATGKDNRVRIEQVLGDSPASRAGVEDDDIVIRYAGDRVFHAGEFQAATNAGVLGETVELVVEREGETYRLSVERGPLGVRIGRARMPPLTRH